VRNSNEGITGSSIAVFTSQMPANTVVGGPEPLKLRKILDVVRTVLYLIIVFLRT
jgi:hypothetical protein